MATKDDFDLQTVNILDQIATLLKVTQNLRSMEATFKNSRELSGREGKPYADTVTRFSAKTAGRLMKAVFANDKKRFSHIASAQKSGAKAIPSAIEAAQALAMMEREAMAVSGAKGNVIETLVVKPLQELNKSWSGC